MTAWPICPFRFRLAIVSLTALTVSAQTPYTDDELLQIGLTREQVPTHIAVIMDGNGRWAKSRGLPRVEGHRRGVGTVRRTTRECSKLGVEQLTLYCLSSENWSRPPRELRLLMKLLGQFVVEERSELMTQGLRLTMIGRREGIDEPVLREVDRTIEMTANNTGMNLCLAVNYGARGEIVDGFRSLLERCLQDGRDPSSLTEEDIAASLYTAGMPDPDLVIRTANEKRLSNFLLWQISYAELWVTEKCWPEFAVEDLHAALLDFSSRQRRYGGLQES